jgi:NitT/TauT family transport system substrate-binding protein
LLVAGINAMKKIITIIIIIIAILAAGMGIFSLTNPPSHYTGPLLPLTIGGPALETSGLIYIAEDQHYFARNGLNVTERTYDSGGATVGGLLKNDMDIGMMSEFVMANTILKGENITSVGSIDKFEDMFLVGRKDRGTDTIPGLMGKTVGIPKGTIADFYFGRFLELHRMNVDNISIIDVRPANSPGAIINGSVDAVITWHPYLDTIPGQNTGNVTIWPIQSGQLTYWNAVCRADWVHGHQAEIERFLRSIAEAEQFSQQHPDEAKLIVQKRLGYNDAYMTTILPDHQFSLSLDRGMIAAMKDEARWTTENSLVNATRIPYFPDYMYVNGLENVKSESVDLG